MVDMRARKAQMSHSEIHLIVTNSTHRLLELKLLWFLPRVLKPSPHIPVSGARWKSVRPMPIKTLKNGSETATAPFVFASVHLSSSKTPLFSKIC